MTSDPKEALERMNVEARQLWGTRQEACALYGADIPMPTISIPVDLLCSLIADRDKLEAEVERLRELLTEAVSGNAQFEHQLNGLQDFLQTAEAKFASLEEALNNSTVALEFVSERRGGQEARKFREQAKANRALLDHPTPVEAQPDNGSDLPKNGPGNCQPRQGTAPMAERSGSAENIGQVYSLSSAAPVQDVAGLVEDAFKAGFAAGLCGNPLLTDDDDAHGDGGQADRALAAFQSRQEDGAHE